MPYCWAEPFQDATLGWVSRESLVNVLLLGWTLSTVDWLCQRVTVEGSTAGLNPFNALRWTVSISTVDWVFREPLLKAYCWAEPFQCATLDCKYFNGGLGVQTESHC